MVKQHYNYGLLAFMGCSNNYYIPPHLEIIFQWKNKLWSEKMILLLIGNILKVGQH